MVRFSEAAGRDSEDERIRMLMDTLDVHSLDSPGYADIAARMQMREDSRSAMQRLFLTVLDDARSETLRTIVQSN